MSDLFQLVFTPDAEQIAAKNRTLKTRVFGELQSTMTIQMGILQRHVKADKLSGQVLKNRTGNLRNAIFMNVEASTEAIVGTVGLDPNGPAWYGIIHEFGGVFHSRGKLSQRGPGRKPYDIHFPMRSFQRTALADRKAAILEALGGAVVRGANQ